MARAIYVVPDTDSAMSAILAAIPTASVRAVGDAVHTDADDVSAVHALAAENYWPTQAGAAEGLLWGTSEKTPVAYTIRDANGRSLVPPGTDLLSLPLALLPVTHIDRHYRGLIYHETWWRLEDLDDSDLSSPSRGRPKTTAHPVCRLVTSWTPSAVGPAERRARLEFYATDGTTILQVPWTPKPFGLRLGAAPEGQLSTQDAAEIRRLNVTREIRQHGETAIPLWQAFEASQGRTPPSLEDCSAALIGLVSEHKAAYLDGDPSGIIGGINAATAAATLAPSGPLGWMLHEFEAVRPTDPDPVADSCGDHMLDALVDPSA